MTERPTASMRAIQRAMRVSGERIAQSVHVPARAWLELSFKPVYSSTLAKLIDWNWIEFDEETAIVRYWKLAERQS